VQLVPCAVLFAGFMPGCDASALPPWLGEPAVELVPAVELASAAFFC